MKKSVLSALCECPVFAGLKEQDVEKIAEKYMTLSATEKNEIIFSENKYTRSLVIIIKGKVSVIKKSGNSEILMNILSKGDIFGMATLFYEKENYLTEIKALEKVTLAIIDKENVKNIFSEFPEVSENYIRILSEKIHFLNKKISTYTKAEAIQKISSFIIQYADKEKNQAVLPYNITTVAESLNMGRASVYRAFECLENDGIISRSGKNIIIKNYEALENI